MGCARAARPRRVQVHLGPHRRRRRRLPPVIPSPETPPRVEADSPLRGRVRLDGGRGRPRNRRHPPAPRHGLRHRPTGDRRRASFGVGTPMDTNFAPHHRADVDLTDLRRRGLDAALLVRPPRREACGRAAARDLHRTDHRRRRTAPAGVPRQGLRPRHRPPHRTDGRRRPRPSRPTLRVRSCNRAPHRRAARRHRRRRGPATPSRSRRGRCRRGQVLKGFPFQLGASGAPGSRDS